MFSSSWLLFLLAIITFGWNRIRKFLKLMKTKSPHQKCGSILNKSSCWCPPIFFLNNQTQHQQHRTENSQPMDTSPKCSRKSPHLRLFWRMPFLRKSDSMNCSMHPCNGWTWKLRNMPSSWEQMWSFNGKKSWKGQRGGYEMDVDDVDVFSVTWNWTAELIYIYTLIIDLLVFWY